MGTKIGDVVAAAFINGTTGAVTGFGVASCTVNGAGDYTVTLHKAIDTSNRVTTISPNQADFTGRPDEGAGTDTTVRAYTRTVAAAPAAGNCNFTITVRRIAIG